MILPVLYILLFCFFIFKSSFFKNEKIKNGWFLAAFVLKLSAGFFLTWIYTSYYPDRQTADIFKYFDDSKIIFQAMQNHHYSDYIKILSGLGNDNTYFDSTYYNHMNHWYRHYDFGTYNDNHTIIRFNALVMLFSWGNFYVHVVFINFISFIGLTALFKTFYSCFPGKEKMLFAVFFIIPSLLLWGSGVLKEGILLFAMGLLFLSFFNIFIHRHKIISNGIVLLLSAWLILINKNYLLLASLPALICFGLVNHFQIKRPLFIYTILYTGFFFLAVIVSGLFSEENILQTFALKQRDFINVSRGGVFIQNDKYFIRVAPDDKNYLDTLPGKLFKIKLHSRYMYWTNENLNDTLYTSNSTDTATYHLVWDLPYAGSTISISRIEPTVWSLIKTAPRALYNSLCKPGLFSSKSMLEKMAALENIGILIFLAISIFFSQRHFNKNILALCVYTCLVILLLIGFTTPVAGAIVRYKAPILPFLLMCGVLLIDTGRIKNMFRKHRS